MFVEFSELYWELQNIHTVSMTDDKWTSDKASIFETLVANAMRRREAAGYQLKRNLSQQDGAAQLDNESCKHSGPEDLLVICDSEELEHLLWKWW